MKNRHYFWLLAILTNWVACGNIQAIHPEQPQAHDNQKPLNGDFANVVGGELLPKGVWQEAHTLALWDGKGDQSCTATRIGTNLILTAAHCLENPMPNMKIGYGITPIKDANLKIIATVIHPHYDEVNSVAANDAEDDIGLILFSGTLPIAITNIASFSEFPTQAGKQKDLPKVTKAGYGATFDGDTSEPRLRSVELEVMRIDHKNREIEYRRNTGKGTCNGDSGGPGFIKVGDTMKQLGITASGPDEENKEASCNSGNGIDTDARYFRGWITCVTAELQIRFGAKGVSLATADFKVEKGDTSQSACAATRIELFKESYVRVKAKCEAKKNHTYNELTGECSH